MSDYKQRMIREYQELRQRVHKLNEMLIRWQEREIALAERQLGGGR